MKNKCCKHLCCLCKYRKECEWYKEIRYVRKTFCNIIYTRIFSGRDNHNVNKYNIRTNKEK